MYLRRVAITNNLTVYGASWCADCHRSRRYLDSHQIAYDWIDIDQDPAAADKVSELNNGYKSIPTIVFADGSILVEPSDKQLAETLAAIKI